MSMNELADIEPTLLRKYFDLVHQLTGIHLNESKGTMLQGRLRKRVLSFKFDTYEKYFDYLNQHADEVQAFINMVTTNETYFFRTLRVWDYFYNEYLPRFTREHPAKPLQVWSGASSSGEEVYSIAISCEEHREKNPNFNYEIWGSDISTAVLAKAQRGAYVGRSIDGFKENRIDVFNKYLEKNGEEYVVKEKIKKKIHFEVHNLFHPPKYKAHFDIIFLRNVLIYFKQKDQERVLENLALSLKDDGVLIIGESESLNGLIGKFQYQAPLIYKKGKSS